MMFMNELITWLYGKSGRNAHIRKMVEKAIVLLKDGKEIEYKEFNLLLGIGLDKFHKPKRTLYHVINPLKKIQLIQVKRIYRTDGSRIYRTFYYMNREAFYGYMKRVLNDFYDDLK